jgi:hypothetical protein
MSIQDIRTLIADPLNFDRAVAPGDGTSTQFQLPNSPIYPATVVVTVDGVPATIASIDLELGLVVLSAAPALDAKVVITYKWTLISDNTLTDLLASEGSDKMAAAQALDIIANSEVLIQKRIRLLDLQTDGPAVAEALRIGADRLRAQSVDPIQPGTDPYAGMFGVAEHAYDPATALELRWRQVKELVE